MDNVQASKFSTSSPNTVIESSTLFTMQQNESGPPTNNADKSSQPQSLQLQTNDLSGNTEFTPESDFVKNQQNSLQKYNIQSITSSSEEQKENLSFASENFRVATKGSHTLPSPLSIETSKILDTLTSPSTIEKIKMPNLFLSSAIEKIKVSDLLGKSTEKIKLSDLLRSGIEKINMSDLLLLDLEKIKVSELLPSAIEKIKVSNLLSSGTEKIEVSDLHPSVIEKFKISEMLHSGMEGFDKIERTNSSSSIEKIALMSKILTTEANALRDSIKTLSQDIANTKLELSIKNDEEDITDFTHHLFLLELIINKVSMKCECFEIDNNNLVISATFLGKHPITLYDCSFGKIENFNNLNVGKSILFAMTYDKICKIQEFEITLEITKQPPCSHCMTKIGMTRINYTKEFKLLREKLCKKWTEEQPKDNIICTTSTPLLKNQFYLTCGESNSEPIGIIEVTLRMSFLGKEITTAFSAFPSSQGTIMLNKDNGMKMYSSQKIEMDKQGKLFLDEEIFNKKSNLHTNNEEIRGSEIPTSISNICEEISNQHKDRFYYNRTGGVLKYDEIFTQINENKMKIKIPKSKKVERYAKYNKLQELCTCENNGEQLQVEVPTDVQIRDKNAHSTIITYNNDSNYEGNIINVTPKNCPLPVDMEKRYHHQKDVFILKIGKKIETNDKNTDLEIELITPKAPPEKGIEKNSIAQQCSCEEVNTNKPIKIKKKSKENINKFNKKNKLKKKYPSKKISKY